jgi:hypothetical protein
MKIENSRASTMAISSTPCGEHRSLRLPRMSSVLVRQHTLAHARRSQRGHGGRCSVDEPARVAPRTLYLPKMHPRWSGHVLAGMAVAPDGVGPVVLAEAVQVAERAERIIVCVGLTDIFESEGFDREHLRVPGNQIALLKAIAHLSERVVVVLVGGSAVEMPWERAAVAILHMQLSGQAGGVAAADLLFGAANPSGKLAESYPVVCADVVNAGYYGVDPEQTPYLESMYCGYPRLNGRGELIKAVGVRLPDRSRRGMRPAGPAGTAGS